jgi:uncharacterized lipoprotein YmbA
MLLRTTLAVIGLAAALTACAAVRPTRFYTLEPATVPKATAPTPAARAKGLPVGLGPVETPAYLDRPEIVTREGNYQVKMAEFDRWAEPLQGMLTGLLADRLGKALQGRREVVELPARGGVEPYFGVAVSIDRFDADESGRVTLDARWRIYQTGDGHTVFTGRKTITEQGAPPPDYPAVVAAMSRAVDDLAKAIAPAVPAPAGKG